MAMHEVQGEEELTASPYNPGGLVMRKRSGTSHAQKTSIKESSIPLYDESLFSPGGGLQPTYF